jgi:hypothetical protein
MEFKSEEDKASYYAKAAYYSRYISALMGVASEAGDIKPSLVMYASSDGKTYDSSIDAHSDEYLVTSDEFQIKILEELVVWAKSGEMGEANLSEELSSFIERVRAAASDSFLEEFPDE